MSGTTPSARGRLAPSGRRGGHFPQMDNDSVTDNGANIVPLAAQSTGAATPDPERAEAPVDIDRLFVLLASLVNLGRVMEASRTSFFETIADASRALNSASEFRRTGQKSVERQIVGQVRSALNAVASLPIPPATEWPDAELLRQEMGL